MGFPCFLLGHTFGPISISPDYVACGRCGKTFRWLNRIHGEDLDEYRRLRTAILQRQEAMLEADYAEAKARTGRAGFPLSFGRDGSP